MSKKVLKVLIIISVIIIIFGILSGISIKNEVSVEKMPTVYVDSIDFTDDAEAFEEIASGFLSGLMIFFSILAVAFIWGAYGIVVFVLLIVKKYKNKNNI